MIKTKFNYINILFTEPQSRAIHFLFYIKQKTLNFEMLDRMVKDLNNHFIETMHLLQENPKVLFENTNYQPEIYSEDYCYRIYITRCLKVTQEPFLDSFSIKLLFTFVIIIININY